MQVTVVNLTFGDDFAVLACDGVWDCRTNHQVVRYFREALRTRRENGEEDEPASKIIEDLFDDMVAKEWGPGVVGNDNMTLLLVTFDDVHRSVDEHRHNQVQPTRRSYAPSLFRWIESRRSDGLTVNDMAD